MTVRRRWKLAAVWIGGLAALFAVSYLASTLVASRLGRPSNPSWVSSVDYVDTYSTTYTVPDTPAWNKLVDVTIAALAEEKLQANYTHELYADMVGMDDSALLVLQASPVPCAELNCRGLDKKVPVTLAGLILQGHQTARAESSSSSATIIAILALIVAAITPALKLIEMATRRLKRRRGSWQPILPDR